MLGKILDKLNLFFGNFYIRLFLIFLYITLLYIDIFREDRFLFESFTNPVSLLLLFDIFVDLCNYIRRKNNLRKGEKL